MWVSQLPPPPPPFLLLTKEPAYATKSDLRRAGVVRVRSQFFIFMHINYKIIINMIFILKSLYPPDNVEVK